MIRICHITSVHSGVDTRIFYKECVSLADNNFEVHLVAPNSVDGMEDGVTRHSVTNNSKSRFYRATIVAFKVLWKALKVKAKVYHFHDPELIWVGTILRCFGKKVIFDIHENIRSQIKDKGWLPMRKTISKIYFLFDWWASKLFYLVLADASYEEMYHKISKHYVIIENLPRSDKLQKFSILDRSQLDNGIIYIGVVSEQRGIIEIIESLQLLDAQNVNFFFHCVGPIDDYCKDIIYSNESYQKIKHKMKIYGALPIYEAYSLSVNCKVGLSILHPIANYIESLSTKIFEYMSVGLPFIVSNFELYTFVSEEKLGVLVDPLSVEDIAREISDLFSNQDRSKEFGRRGLKASNDKYTWSSQEEKLLDFYSKMINE
jgi:glycosyltransferase involved in cell wall biosynthesis